MISTHDIVIKYIGSEIKIGVSKQTGNIYFQPKCMWNTHMWLRFDISYYQDYEDFLKEYKEYEQIYERSIT